MTNMKTFLIAIILLILVGVGAYFIWFGGGQAPTPVATTNPMIKVTTPKAGELISSPLVITGEARGTWFFEASFPVFLTDWDGLIIAQGIAQAEGEWMTEDFVPFKAILNFTKPVYGERGTLILKRDNPSGLPEHDAAVELPILFK